MNLFDLYKKNIEASAFFMQKAKNTQDWEARHSFNVTALTYEEQAGWIAHCIAMFGNLMLNEIDVVELNKQVEEIPCQRGNPWIFGLKMVAKKKNAQS